MIVEASVYDEFVALLTEQAKATATGAPTEDVLFGPVNNSNQLARVKSFFDDFMPKMTCITGWNFIDYDWMYLVNRARKINKIVNGQQLTINPDLSSPTKRMNNIFMTKYELPAHRLIFDYMQLYEICDTSIKVKESSSLDYVSSKLVGVNKIKYTVSLMGK